MEELLVYERNLFIWINSTHTPFLTTLMWPFSGILIWCPVLFVMLYFYLRKRPYGLPASLSIGLVILFSIIISNFIFKPLFARFRPTSHPLYLEHIHLLKNYTADGLYGFISGHTTTAFGFATLSSLLIKNRFYAISIFLWAFLMGYSRIYMGVHFVSDVWAGMLIGSILGWAVFLFYKTILKHSFSANKPKH